MSDPVATLSHDHGELNRRVLDLGGLIRGLAAGADARTLVEPLRDLREMLFLHFAREEEGLFPFVTDQVGELADQVHVMELAHDTICGSLARMVHLASTNASLVLLLQLFDRFENAYAAHATTEAELLAELDSKLDPAQRARLAQLVEGL